VAEPISRSQNENSRSTPARGWPGTSREDAALVERIRAGDARAFEALFATHYQSLYGFAYRYLGSREPAEDAVQDVFRRIWIRHADWEPRVPIRSYLITATRNECLSAVRHDRIVQAAASLCADEALVPGMGSPARDADAEIAAAELSVVIEDAATELPPRCREVFLLRWRHGLSVAETAARVGTAAKSVEAHMTRALCFLRERLEGFSRA